MTKILKNGLSGLVLHKILSFKVNMNSVEIENENSSFIQLTQATKKDTLIKNKIYILTQWK